MANVSYQLIILVLLLLIYTCTALVITPVKKISIGSTNKHSTVCVVTGNMLYANGYFVRELTSEEAAELAEFEVAINEYNKMLHEHLTEATKPSKWIFGGRFILPFEQRTMPRRPQAPAFCTGPDTVIHQLDGCIVQNYRVYIGPLYVRQLNDEEKAELDEYDLRIKEYQERIIENMKRQLGTMVSGVWYPYDRAIMRNRNFLFGNVHEGSVSKENTTSLSSSEKGSAITTTISTTTPTTPAPQPPEPPKFCTQIF